MARVDEARGNLANAELRIGWRILLGSALGIGLGIIALPGPAVGIFMRQWQSEFGWTRTQISVGPTIMILTLALFAPVLGWVADRIRARLIVAFSLSALAACFVLFSQLSARLLDYYLAFGILAVAASGSSTVVYAKLLTTEFHRNRGLALGLAMMGNGATGVLLPLLMVPFAAFAGWRAGYLVLAGVVALVMPIVTLLIGKGAKASAPELNGASAGAASPTLRDRRFWTMAIGFALIPFATSGLHLHFVAFLTDTGISPARAGAIASVGGASLAIARIATGWLIDRFFAPCVAAVMMVGSATALATMGLLGAPAAILGAVAIGISIGAELDLIGYLVSRYFPKDHFGRLYGWLYSSVLIGSAASPVAYGLIVDWTGSYQLALYLASTLLALVGVLFLTLPAFPRPAKG